MSEEVVLKNVDESDDDDDDDDVNDNKIQEEDESSNLLMLLRFRSYNVLFILEGGIGKCIR